MRSSQHKEPQVDNECAICGEVARERLYRLSSGEISRCTGCRTVQRRRPVEEKGAEALYDDDAYLEAPYFEAVKVGAPRDREPYLVYRRVLDRLVAHHPPGRLLDVGCSYGAFLELAGEAGWNTAGVELSRKACNYAARERGMEVFHGTLEQARLADGSFEVVTLWDVIEHLDRPLDTLREIRRILVPGGRVVLFTINQRSLINRIGHLVYRLTLGGWKQPLELLYDIHHNFFFDVGTLRSVLQRGGFERPEVDWLGANISRWQNVPIPKLLATGANILDAVSRITGGRYRMIVYARKPKRRRLDAAVS